MHCYYWISIIGKKGRGMRPFIRSMRIRRGIQHPARRTMITDAHYIERRMWLIIIIIIAYGTRCLHPSIRPSTHIYAYDVCLFVCLSRSFVCCHTREMMVLLSAAKCKVTRTNAQHQEWRMNRRKNNRLTDQALPAVCSAYVLVQTSLLEPSTAAGR